MVPQSKYRKSFAILMALLFFFISAILAFAETKVFVREYTYHASDEDSKNSSRTIALREVKRLLLEELGTYLESETEVRNFQLTKDQIITLTAGIVKTEILDEKWDGRTYWLRAKIAADSEGVIKTINTLRQDRVKTKQLEDARRHSDELLRENERLRKELATAKGEKREKDKTAYDETIKSLTATEWFEKGYASYLSGHYSDAIDAFSKSIELNPKYSEVYFHRGLAYNSLGNYEQEIKDYDKGIELDPKDATNYRFRGAAYERLGNHKQAIRDYDKAIELDPKLATAYNNRGLAHKNLGDHKQAIDDYKIAARLGHKAAQDFLRSKGISW